MSYQCPTCGQLGSCWSPSIIGFPENPSASDAARLRATLEIVKEKLRIDDPHDLYDIVCEALAPNDGRPSPSPPAPEATVVADDNQSANDESSGRT